MNLQNEQESLLNNFDNPIDFIEKYTSIYNAQSNTPFKIFPEMIPYLTKFNILFLDHLFKFIQNNSDKVSVLETEMIKIDCLINKIKEYEFYDHSFYEVCGLIFIKSLVFLIDQCEYKILSEEDPKVIIQFINTLYKFTPLPIDLNNLFFYWIRKSDNFINTLRKIKEIIDLFSLPDFITSFKDDKRLLSRLTCNDIYLGKERVNVYYYEEIVISTVKFIIDQSGLLSKEEKYNLVIEFHSELEMNGLSDENIHNKIRNLCNELIQ